jgi:hypothetical protein
LSAKIVHGSENANVVNANVVAVVSTGPPACTRTIPYTMTPKANATQDQRYGRRRSVYTDE